MEIPVRDLKDHLSEYLRRVQAGEELIITSHGKPVARLAPAYAPKAEPEAEALARLRAQAWIRPGKGAKLTVPERPIVWPADDKPLAQIILEDRD